DVIGAYAWVGGVLARALAALGAPLAPRGDGAPLSVRPRTAGLCFHDTTALDLVDAAGRKVVGSAQRRVGRRVLHHGSIPLSVPAASPGAGALALAAGRAVGWDEAADAVAAGFAAALGGRLHPAAPSRDEEHLAAR